MHEFIKQKSLQNKFIFGNNVGCIFFLPPYSPHLNIIERLWKEIKSGWIKPEDYADHEILFYAINRIFANIGTEICLNFGYSQFKIK